MAQIVEETITVTLSQLAKNGVKPESVISDELLATIETVVQELVSNGVVVDVTTSK